jgi:hypothetical protein
MISKPWPKNVIDMPFRINSLLKYTGPTIRVEAMTHHAAVFWE